MHFYGRHIVNGISQMLTALLVAGLAVGCSSDVEDIYTPEVAADTTDCYFQLNISVNANGTGRATRSPKGGEDGDGRENGTDAENAVSRVTVFLYQGTDGINSTDASNVTVHAYCWNVALDGSSSSTSTDNIEKTYTTGAQRLPHSLVNGEAYHLLVVANLDLSALDGKTLADVRDYVYTQSPFLVADANKPYEATRFVMSSEKDGEPVTLTLRTGDETKGSVTNPFTASTNIERLAARIDFNTYGGELVKGLTLKDGTQTKADTTLARAYAYAVASDDASTSTTAVPDTFYLTAVYPFNEAQQSYLFKRVGEPATATPYYTNVSYLADETKDATISTVTNAALDTATNYVIAPYFDTKSTPSNLPDDFFIPTMRRTYFDLEANAEAAEALYHVRDSAQFNSDNAYGFVVGYTSENTFPAVVQANDTCMRRVATGLTFTGVYKFANGTYVHVHYDYYLRHGDNDTATDAGPMKYGVVRNNIYRVSIGKVNVLNEFYLKLRIKVVPWQDYVHETIVM